MHGFAAPSFHFADSSGNSRPAATFSAAFATRSIRRRALYYTRFKFPRPPDYLSRHAAHTMKVSARDFRRRHAIDVAHARQVRYAHGRKPSLPRAMTRRKRHNNTPSSAISACPPPHSAMPSAKTPTSCPFRRLTPPSSILSLLIRPAFDVRHQPLSLADIIIIEYRRHAAHIRASFGFGIRQPATLRCKPARRISAAEMRADGGARSRARVYW